MSDNKRILLVTIPEKGHVNPMIGIAQMLQKLGYELAFFAKANISAQLQKADLNVPVYFDITVESEGVEFVSKGKDFAEKLQDKAWLQNWIKTLLIDAVPQQVAVLEAVAEAFDPSLIVADPMVYAAAIVASRRGIPWAGVSSSLNPITPADWKCALTDTLQFYQKERARLFADYPGKVEFRVSDLISPWLNIVFSTEAYIPREWSKNNFSFYVGKSYTAGSRGDEQGFPFHLLKKDAKKVYMSLGSQVYYHPRLFEVVQDVFRGTDTQLIFAVNELINTSFKDRLDEEVIAVHYAPQLQLLPHVDLMISHGGANSVMECLSLGKPIAVLPICNDQFLQAQFVLSAKVGKVLEVKNPEVGKYKDQLLPLLDAHAEERINAVKVGKAFSKHLGPVEAADLIDMLWKKRKPLMPKLEVE